MNIDIVFNYSSVRRRSLTSLVIVSSDVFYLVRSRMLILYSRVIFFFVFFCFFVLTRLGVFCQDISFSQISKIPLILNPANAGLGSEQDCRIGVNYRVQGTVTGRTFETYNIWSDFDINLKSFPNSWLGLGVLIANDKTYSNIYNTSNLNAVAAYHMLLSERSVLSLGTVFSYETKKLLSKELVFEDQFNGLFYDKSISTQEHISNSVHYNSLGIGINYFNSFSEKFSVSVGISVGNINRPKFGFLHVFDKSNNLFVIDKMLVPFRYNFSLFNKIVLSDIVALCNQFIFTRKKPDYVGLAGSGLLFDLSVPHFIRNSFQFYFNGYYRINTAAFVFDVGLKYNKINLCINYRS